MKEVIDGKDNGEHNDKCESGETEKRIDVKNGSQQKRARDKKSRTDI